MKPVLTNLDPSSRDHPKKVVNRIRFFRIQISNTLVHYAPYHGRKLYSLIVYYYPFSRITRVIYYLFLVIDSITRFLGIC